MEMEELVQRIVRALVDFPQEVDVREISGINATLLEIKVSKQDMGYLIGRKGKNIDALRRVVPVATRDQRHMVEVIDPRYCQQWLAKGEQ